jgi:hypothetical protein
MHMKRQAVDDTVDVLRGRFGTECIIPSSLIKQKLTGNGLPPVFVPVGELVKTVHRQGHSFIGLAAS